MKNGSIFRHINLYYYTCTLFDVRKLMLIQIIESKRIESDGCMYTFNLNPTFCFTLKLYY